MRYLLRGFIGRSLSLLFVFLMLFMGVVEAQARIQFQDDFYHDIHSPGIIIDYDGAGATDTVIRFGSDLNSSENGNIVWDISSNEFNIDNSVAIIGNLDVAADLEARGDVKFHLATQFRIREDSDPDNNATCKNLGELIYDTSDDEVQICVTVGVAPDADWESLLGSVNYNFLRSDISDNYENGVLTFDPGTTLDVDEAIVNLDEITNNTLTLDGDNTGAGADVDIIANQGTDTDGVLRYSAVNNRWELSNDGAGFLPILVASDLVAVQIRRDTSYSVTKSWRSLSMPLTDIENDVSVLEHNDVDVEYIDIKEAGLYQVSYSVSGVSYSCTYALGSRVILNDSDVVSGTFLENRESRREYMPITSLALVELDAGDSLSLQVKRMRNCSISLRGETTFSVVKLGLP